MTKTISNFKVLSYLNLGCSDFCFFWAGFVGCARKRRVRNVQLVQRAGVGFFPLSLVCGGARARAAFGEGEAGWEICLSVSVSLSLYLSVCAVCACVCMYVCVCVCVIVCVCVRARVCSSCSRGASSRLPSASSRGQAGNFSQKRPNSVEKDLNSKP